MQVLILSQDCVSSFTYPNERENIGSPCTFGKFRYSPDIVSKNFDFSHNGHFQSVGDQINSFDWILKAQSLPEN